MRRSPTRTFPRSWLLAATLLSVSPLASVSSLACAPLLKLAAQPPDASAGTAHVLRDPATPGVATLAIDVSLFNPNPIPLTIERFDFRVDAGGASWDGSVATGDVLLASGQGRIITLTVPLAAAPDVQRAIEAGAPFRIVGSLVLGGAVTGLAVGVGGEGVLARGGQVRIVAMGQGGSF